MDSNGRCVHGRQTAMIALRSVTDQGAALSPNDLNYHIDIDSVVAPDYRKILAPNKQAACTREARDAGDWKNRSIRKMPGR